MRNIVLIDRDEGEADLLTTQLRQFGYSVTRFDGAPEHKAAPELAPRTWYGMPAYALDGKVICFFQNAGKFKARYGTLGFSDKAKLDEVEMWPTSFAVTELSAEVEARITELVKRAVG